MTDELNQEEQPRVLLVDDDPTFTRVMARALSRRGLQVDTAGGAEEAMEVARAQRPDYAVLDLKMEGDSGLVLMPRLLELYPDLRIVILTGYSSIATAVEAIKRGACNYLCKPADADDVLTALLSEQADTSVLTALAPGLTPEMVAAVSKLMRVQDLILVAGKCEVVTAFRSTIGRQGRMSTRLQPNHPTDDPAGVAASVLDGLLYGNGDAVIGINPATDNYHAVTRLMRMLDDVIRRYDIPTQSCVLTHVTTHLEAINRGEPVDLVFQSIAGTEAANASFGVSLSLLDEAHQAALALGRGTVGQNVMYFETGQGSALSADAHHGVDQQTCEARAYAVARRFDPLLVNTVVGFIGPEYLYDGKQIIRAGLEDHFCGKLLGVPMGCDICYTNHAEADQDDMDVLLTLLGAAGINFIMGIPGADDIMLNYQTTSFHDAWYLRQVLGKRPAPEFEAWLERMGITDAGGRLKTGAGLPNAFAHIARHL